MFLQYPEAYQIFRNDNENSFTFRKQSLYQDETALGTWHLCKSIHTLRHLLNAMQNADFNEEKLNEISCLRNWGILFKSLQGLSRLRITFLGIEYPFMVSIQFYTAVRFQTSF